MTVLTLSASGRLPPDEVWERYAVPARWSQWAPQLRRVECSDDRLAFGTTGRVYGPLGSPFEIALDFVVESVDEDARRWSWTVRRGALTLYLEHAVRPRGGGSATSLRVDGPLPVLLAYAPVAQLSLQLLVSRRDTDR